MDFKKLADKAKKTMDDRGGTDRLKQDAERLRDIATGPGSPKDKARAAGDALKEPGRADNHTSQEPPTTPPY